MTGAVGGKKSQGRRARRRQGWRRAPPNPASMEATDELPAERPPAPPACAAARAGPLPPRRAARVGRVRHGLRGRRRAARPRRRGQGHPDRARRRPSARRARRWPPRGSTTRASSRVFDAGEDGEARYLVSELVRGRTLDRARGRRRAVGPRRAAGRARAGRRARARPRPRRHPPRRQAAERDRPRPPALRALGGEADRLRRRAPGRRRVAHAHRRRRRHARLHGPGAGRRPAGRRARRPLLARARALRGPRGREPGARPAARPRPRAGSGRCSRRCSASARTCRPSCARRSTARSRRARRTAARSTSSPTSSREALTDVSDEGGTILAHPLERPRTAQLPPVAGADRGRAGRRRPRGGGRSRSSPARRSPRSPRRERPRWPSPRCRGSAGSPCAVALAVLLAPDRPGAALVVLAGRRAPPRRSCAAPAAPGRCPPLAPLLGLAALAGAYPAAGRARAARWWQRAGLGAAGLWWLLLAESLLDTTLLSARRPAARLGGRRGPRARRRAAAAAGLRADRARRALWALGVARAAVAGARPLRRASTSSPPPHGPRALGAGTAALAEWAGADAAAGPRRRGDRGGRARLAAAPPAPAGYRGRRPPAMSVLRNLESKLAGLVEGTFSRAFKSEVRPVEIARKLTREMEENKVQSLSRTYAPNEYAVWLSPDDRKQFEGYEDDLATELSGYLLEHARRERIALVTSPEDQLPHRRPAAAGRVRHPGAARAPGRGRLGRRRARATRATRWSTRPPSGSSEQLREPDHRRGAARLRYEGKTAVLRSSGGVIGRSRDCDVVLSDQNVSRAPRRGPPERRQVDRQGPRLHQRRQGQRPPHPRRRSRSSPATRSSSARPRSSFDQD